MLCWCEREEQTALHIMSDYNIDLGEWGVSSVPASMAKIVHFKEGHMDFSTFHFGVYLRKYLAP